MSKDELARALGRAEREPWDAEIGSPILVTGARGSIGEALVDRLRDKGYDVRATDIADMDVRSINQVKHHMDTFDPKVVFHLAGAKHAPEGEEDPYSVATINAVGTHNVLYSAPEGCVVVVASTCKAANPETAYGASKLIAERMTLNAGQRVARFYNVVESADNVFELWANLPGKRSPIPVTLCERYFISLDEALSLLLRTAAAPPGRYTVNPGSRRSMTVVAEALYPGRHLNIYPKRRGDRVNEPLLAEHEIMSAVENDWFMKITSPHDVQEEA